MRFELVEQYRSKHPLGFEHNYGDNFGWFQIPSDYDRKKLFVMACDSDEENKWQHCSVSKEDGRTPNWREMCQIKNLFWTEDEVVVQFHPKKKDYVNVAKNCLHLWKLDGEEFPTPGKWMV